MWRDDERLAARLAAGVRAESGAMKAMRYPGGRAPLRLEQCPLPEPGRGQVRVRVEACGVCRTDLHLVDDELPEARRPITPGHEIVGRIDRLGEDVSMLAAGERVGVPWLGRSCGHCRWCASGRENLCDEAAFTGYQIDGGYADYAVADARYCFRIPDAYDAVAAAPLLCAGLIGYRALCMAGDAERLGIYGFGAAGHIVAQVARHQGRTLYAFTRAGDTEAQILARDLGADWAGSSEEAPPEKLDAALIFAPVGALVPEALRRLDKGGRVVCAGIHMSPIPSFPYRILWQERSILSVANLTRRDAEEFLALAPEVPVRCRTQRFPLADANEALRQLRAGELCGAAVLDLSL